MENYSQTNQNVENINNDKNFKDMPTNDREFFILALSEVIDAKMRENNEEIEDTINPQTTRQHKIRMNRLFRERVGGSFLPFPKVDNLYERARSKLIIRLRINEFLDRRREQRQAK